MVIGNGLVAKGFIRFTDDTQTIIFASGVSNSTTDRIELFQREMELINKTVRDNQDKTFVYFSTCSIYDMTLQKSPYVIHKLAVEEFIARECKSYHVFRISNIAGFTNNPHTILNYFIQHIQFGKQFSVWKNAGRNIIDIEDAVSLCTYFIQKKLHHNKIINIANPATYPVMQIIAAIEKFVGCMGNYKITEKGSSPGIDVSLIAPYFSQLQLYFPHDYLNKILLKYYL